MAQAPERNDVEDLARWVDPDSPATFLSLYADLTDRRHEEELADRARTIAGVLTDERNEAFDAALEDARGELAALRSRQARGTAVFVSPERDRSRAFALAEPVATRLVWDTSPYVRPLARFLDDYEDLAIVLVDGQRATIHHVAAADPERVFSRSLDLQGRHKKGGWSQMRYQRARATSLRRFREEIVRALDRLVQEHGVEQVVVAGEGTMRDQLANKLPSRLLERLTSVEAVDRATVTESELLRRLTELGRRREAETSAQAIETVLSRLERGELATADPFEVARAARDGRVDLLVVDEGSQPGGAKCETHDTVFPRGSTCACGSQGTPVDLANEAVEDAVRSDATVEFGEAERLREVGGLAALLRW